MTTKTKAKKRKARSSRPSEPRAQPTLGPWVAAWIERFVVHGPGDYLGEPFRLQPFQRSFIDDCYRLQETGARQYDRVVFGLPKGNGKTELAAAIALAELAGPVVFDGWDRKGRPRARKRTSPDIPVAAASFDQADTLFGSAREMVKHGPLEPFFESFETEIYPKNGEGRLYRVAAVAGPNDGRRPSCVVADELHEWEGKKERVHMVLSNGRAKRADAWELSISTAGWNIESLLGRLYSHGQAVKAGREEDQRLLMVWYEAPADVDLDDPEARLEAIRIANPACGAFMDERNIDARYHEVPEHEFRRYYLNQWTAVPEMWISPELWDSAARPDRVVEEGTPISLGFDGSYNQDSTALIGCTIEDAPHLFTLGVWDRPDGVKDWTVDKQEVVDVMLEACERYDVRSVPCDDTFGRVWSTKLEWLATKGIPVLEWPTRSPSRMAPACGQFWGALSDGQLTHDGDERLGTHMANCRLKTDRWGPRIVKEHRGSTKRIDAAVAAVIAHDMVIRDGGSAPSPYSDHDVLVI